MMQFFACAITSVLALSEDKIVATIDANAIVSDVTGVRRADSAVYSIHNENDGYTDSGSSGTDGDTKKDDVTADKEKTANVSKDSTKTDGSGIPVLFDSDQLALPSLPGTLGADAKNIVTRSQQVDDTNGDLAGDSEVQLSDTGSGTGKAANADAAGEGSDFNTGIVPLMYGPEDQEKYDPESKSQKHDLIHKHVHQSDKKAGLLPGVGIETLADGMKMDVDESAMYSVTMRKWLGTDDDIKLMASAGGFGAT